MTFNYKMLTVNAVEAGASLKVGKCYNADTSQVGPDLFTSDDILSQDRRVIYSQYKQVDNINNLPQQDIIRRVI